jgi:hypothetical protein
MTKDPHGSSQPVDILKALSLSLNDRAFFMRGDRVKEEPVLDSS